MNDISYISTACRFHYRPSQGDQLSLKWTSSPRQRPSWIILSLITLARSQIEPIVWWKNDVLHCSPNSDGSGFKFIIFSALDLGGYFLAIYLCKEEINLVSLFIPEVLQAVLIILDVFFLLNKLGPKLRSIDNILIIDLKTKLHIISFVSTHSNKSVVACSSPKRQGYFGDSFQVKAFRDKYCSEKCYYF